MGYASEINRARREEGDTNSAVVTKSKDMEKWFTNW